MSKAAPPALLPCGHFAQGVNPDGSPRCSICGEREAVARMVAQQAAVSRLDPTRGRSADVPATGAGVGWATAEKVLGDRPTAGVYTLPDSIYHADPLRAYGTESLSASGAVRLLPPNTPAHYRWWVDHPKQPTAAMILGSATHALTLGTADLAIFSGKSWTSEAGRAFLADHDPDGGEAPILAGDVPAATAMADALRAHPLVRLGLTGGHPEQAMFARHPEGAWLRGKVDYLAAGAGGRLIITDVKTAEHADAESFAKSGGDLGYDIQASGYEWLAGTLGLGRRVTVIFAVVEKTPPYLVAVHEFHSDDMALAREVYEVAARRFAHCAATGKWPGYPHRINRVSLPPWAVRSRDEASVSTEGEDQ